MIQGIDNSQIGYSASATYNKTITGASLSIGGHIDKDGAFTGDQVSFSYFKIEQSATYNRFGTITAAADAAYDLLRSHVLDVFEKQGLGTTINIGDRDIDLQQLSQQDAQALIAEDGYFGVEQTSDRIVDFAIGIAGGDPTRLDAILAGVEKGFQEALEAFGGWLPDISYQTYDAVQQKLDTWANGNQAVS
ncbi:MAG: hypothetical protein KQH59_01550 [Desulfobulbaceae bacterium]|nr:hypothetical protein [Desulfobulbaceae bacterium]